LGRAWGRYSKVVFVYTDIEAPIYPDGWYNWGDPTREK
jgi:pectinesterase